MPNATLRANARTLPEATTRRAALGAIIAAGAAGATALAASADVIPRALSAELDPVLALAAKVRAAWNRVEEIITEQGDDEGERCDEAWRLFEAAHAELLETPPTTLAGARAAIAWLIEYDEPNIPETSGEYMRTLIRSPIFAQEEARA
jgi:hypothetical protein